MTRKNNHYDNAQAESLWSRFKAELLEKGVFDSLEDAYTETFEYIEIYYNKKRWHSGLDYQFPCTFEQQFLDVDVRYKLKVTFAPRRFGTFVL